MSKLICCRLAANMSRDGEMDRISDRRRCAHRREDLHPLAAVEALDIGDFFPSESSSSSEWVPVRQGRRHRFWHQHEGTVAFTAALANILAITPSRRVIVGTAVDAGAVRKVELEIVTELECKANRELFNMIGYSKRFTEFFPKDCPGGGVFRWL